MTPPWGPLRDIDVPLGARARVRQRVEAALAGAPPRPRRRRRVLVLAGVLVAGVALASVATIVRERPGAPPRAVIVADGARVELAVGRGHASVVGPAEARLVGRTLHISAGTVETLGAVMIAGPRCTAEVEGSAQVSVRGDATQVRVFAGFARVVQADPLCEVIDLTGATSAAGIDQLGDAIDAAIEPAVAPPVEAVDAGVADAETIVALTPPAHASTSPAARPATDDGLAPSARPRPTPISPAARPATDDGLAPSARPRPTPISPAARSATDDGLAPAARPRPTPTSRPAPLDDRDASPAPGDDRDASPAPDPLAAQVAAYRAAAAREAADPADGLAAWRAYLARWPSGAMATSAELRVLAVLGRLGRRDAQRSAARAFLDRHADSPRAADVRRLLEAP
ncbi:MAG: hypothetical protein IPL61_19780 [Myxococcales bacterium]|nr:hypothetical protein [Myxococcales bacterium]